MKSDIRGYAAIDCEMVETIGNENALARVSIVDEQCNVLYDAIVIPPGGQVVTYRTRYSGITAALVKAKGIAFETAQSDVKRITDQFRLVGHTINNDLGALELVPKNEIVDIGDLQELKNRYKKAVNHDTGNERIGLKRLSAALLLRLIQEGNQGHSSVEDAIATMQLFQLVQAEFEARCPDLAGVDLMDDRFWDDNDDEDDNEMCTVDNEFSEDYI